LTDLDLGPLFAVRPTPPRDETHHESLRRVTSAIGADVLAFLRARVGQQFHADELRAYVDARHQCAPASADRICRALRQAGKCRVVLVSRAQSLYLCEAVAP
jgi:hypothetical protein